MVVDLISGGIGALDPVRHGGGEGRKDDVPQSGEMGIELQFGGVDLKLSFRFGPAIRILPSQFERRDGWDQPSGLENRSFEEGDRDFLDIGRTKEGERGDRGENEGNGGAVGQ